MKGFYGNIESLTKENGNFRKVIFTAPHSQLVVMCLLPGEEIGDEVHDVDQFFKVVEGHAKFVIDGEELEAHDYDAVVVPAGLRHNVVNASVSEMLKLYTIYSPANHPDGTVFSTKSEAIEVEEHEQQ